MNTRTFGSKAAVMAAFFVAFMALALWHSAPARATTFNAGDVATLKMAINDANNEVANPGPDTINLTANGNYELASVDNTTDGPNGLPSVTTEITIEGNRASIFRSLAANTPEFRILHVATSGNLTLEDVTVSGGVGVNDGGGILSAGDVTITDATFSNNSAVNGGGGIANSRGDITVTDSTFSNNSATGGGGIITFEGPATVENSSFSGNSAGTTGGGLSLLELNDAADTVLTVSDSNFSGNTAVGGGGGINNFESELVVSGSTFTENTTPESGGGIASVSANIPTPGGSPPEERTSITNSTFSDNTATPNAGAGGAIANAKGFTEISFSTITGNIAGPDRGGGVVTFASGATRTKISSSIVTGNSTDVDAPADDRPFESGGFNLIGTGDRTADFDGTGDRTGVSVANAFGTATPALASNGGPTGTIAIGVDAFAIDAANPTVFPDSDQRGFPPRPQGGGPDVGAFEFEASGTAVTFAAGKNLVTFPQKVGVTGTLTGGNATPLANKEIIIERRDPGRQNFQRIGTATTNANGEFSAAVGTPRNGLLRARFAERGGDNPSVSVEATVNVRAVVNLRLSRSSVKPGDKVVISGKVLPAKRGFVNLTIRGGGKVANKRVKLGGDGSYRFAYRVPGRGNYLVQVRFPGDADNLANSASKRFRAR